MNHRFCPNEPARIGFESSSLRFGRTDARPIPVCDTTRAGFTLIELLTVIAIIGILAAILIPVVGSVRESARTAQASSNVRQIGSAMHVYIAENDGRLPTDLFGSPMTRNWMQELWDIAHSGEEMPEFGAGIHGNVLRNSIFYTPNLEDVAVDGGGQPRSFGWSVSLRLNSAGSVGDGRYHGQISGVENPSMTVALSDSKSSSNIRAGSPQINYRNKGRAIFLFVDGHIELRSPEQVPANENHVFWGGTETESATPRR
jgi:prepilin-type N-terminal cleavage/methylation domain-containing protein/prepilin-type processing-associated H-X9-DG protein